MKIKLLLIEQWVVLPELGSTVLSENSTSAKEMAEWPGAWKGSLGLLSVQQQAFRSLQPAHQASPFLNFFYL